MDSRNYSVWLCLLVVLSGALGWALSADGWEESLKRVMWMGITFMTGMAFVYQREADRINATTDRVSKQTKLED
jgi:heme/copper-type cytochrome/quinol oxidase subunit 3